MTSDEFIAMLAQPAQAIQASSGIPASFLIAQAALESDWFASAPARQALNLFGIRAGRAWRGETIVMPIGEYIDERPVIMRAVFCKYPDLASGLKAYAAYLTKNPRYAFAFAHKGDPRVFAKVVAEAQHAAEPTYAQTLIGIIDAHKLENFDTDANHVAVPEPQHGPTDIEYRLKRLVQPLIDAGSRIAWRARESRYGTPTSASTLPRNAPVLVPGSQPMVPYVFADSAKNLAMIWKEKAMAKTQHGLATVFLRQIANNTARLNFVKKFAGTDEELQNAIDARSAATAPYQGKLGAAPPIEVQPVLDHLETLRQQAAGTDLDMMEATERFKTAIQREAKPGPNGQPMIAPFVLDGLEEMAMNYFKLSSGAGSGTSPTLEEFARVKNTIGDMLDHAVPGYAEYVAQYMKNSAPINEMRLFRTLGAHEGIWKPNAIAEPTIALDKVQLAAMKANDPYTPITPDGRVAIENLLADLSNEASFMSEGDTARGPDISPHLLESRLHVV